MRFDGNSGGAVNYEPNSMGGPKDNAKYLEPPLKISGDADRYDHRAGNDDYTQPGNLFRLMNEDQKAQLFGNIAAAMQGSELRIQVRQLAHFFKADPAYGRGVAKALGLDADAVQPWSALSLDQLIAATTAEAFTGIAYTNGHQTTGALSAV
jgi:catalase